MSAEVGRAVIDSLEFARTGQTLCGSLALSGLKRLHDGLCDTLGRVDFAVHGGRDERQRPRLIVEANGVLHLTCQRCLGQLDFPLRVRSVLLLLTETQMAEAAGDDEAEGDWLEASAELDVARVVEDEIILSLPYSPRHPEGECGTRNPGTSSRNGEHALAGLAALKRNPN